MVCSNKRLVMEVKSGEARGFNFTIKTKSGLLNTDGTPQYIPMNLAEYTVEFDIKQYPYYSVKSLVSKVITTTYSADGEIYEPVGGKFRIQVTLDDLKKLVPSQDYYVIITLVNGNTRIIISGEGNTSGVFRFCKS